RAGHAAAGSRRARWPAAWRRRDAGCPPRPRTRAGARSRTRSAASRGRLRPRSLDALQLLADDGDLFHQDVVGAGFHRAGGDLGRPGVDEVVPPDLLAVVAVHDHRAVLAGVGDLPLVDLLVPVPEVLGGVLRPLERDRRRLAVAGELVDDVLPVRRVLLQLDHVQLGGEAAHLLELGDVDAVDLDAVVEA